MAPYQNSKTNILSPEPTVMTMSKDATGKNVLHLTNAEHNRLISAGIIESNSISVLHGNSIADILKKYPGIDAEIRLQISGNKHHTFHDVKDFVCNEEIFASDIRTSASGKSTITLYTANALHDIDVHLQKDAASKNAHSILTEIEKAYREINSIEKFIETLIDKAPYEVFETVAPMVGGNSLNEILNAAAEHLPVLKVPPLVSQELQLPNTLIYDSTRNRFADYLLSQNLSHPELVELLEAYKCIIPDTEYMDIAFKLNDTLSLDYHEVIKLTDPVKVPIYQETIKKDLWAENAHSLGMNTEEYKNQIKLYCTELSSEDLKIKAEGVISCELDITNELPWTTTHINELEQTRIKHFLDIAFTVRDLPAISNDYYMTLNIIKDFEKPVSPTYEQDIKKLGISAVTFQKRVFSMMRQSPEELLETAKSIKTENYTDKDLLKIDNKALEHVVCMSPTEHPDVVNYFYGSEESLSHRAAIQAGWMQLPTLPDKSELRFRDATTGNLDRKVSDVAKATFQEAVDYYKPGHCYYFVNENIYFQLHSINDGLMRFDSITSEQHTYIPIENAGTYLPDVSTNPIIKTTDGRYFKRNVNNKQNKQKRSNVEKKAKKSKPTSKKTMRSAQLQQQHMTLVR